MTPEEINERIGAQTAKQVMIQKIREAERDHLYNEYDELKGQLVTGTIQRYEGGAATVALQNVEAILPRGEQIPGETHHVNERVRATVYEVKKAGTRVKVILSRTKPQLVQRLFEQEIPEIAEGVIEMRSIAREPGYRTKVAVSSMDQRVDCVGACVGVRGNRIKNIVDELAGERIDIVRWNDDMQVLIPNALQPAGSGGSDPLPDAGPGDRAGPRGPALAGDRQAGAERPPGQQALRLGHRDHDPRRAGRADRAGRGGLLRAGRNRAGTGREARRRRLPLLRRPLGHRAGRPDGNGRPEPRSRCSVIVDQAEAKAEEAEKAAAEQRRQRREQEERGEGRRRRRSGRRPGGWPEMPSAVERPQNEDGCRTQPPRTESVATEPLRPRQRMKPMSQPGGNGGVARPSDDDLRSRSDDGNHREHT